MKKFKSTILLLLVFLIIAGCSKKQTAQEEYDDIIEESSSSETISRSADEDDVFYEPRDKKTEESTATIPKKAETTKETKGKLEVIKTENGNFKVEMTDGWQVAEENELSDNADVSLKKAINNEYYMVLSESKKDFENFEAFKRSVDLSDLGERTNEKIEKIKYNGLKGERRKFNATKDGVSVFYIYDLMEGQDHYLQCMSWTPTSDKENNEADMIKMMNSLFELEN